MDEGFSAVRVASSDGGDTFDHLSRTGRPDIREWRTQLPPAWWGAIDVEHALGVLDSSEGSLDHDLADRGAGACGVAGTGAWGAGRGACCGCRSLRRDGRVAEVPHAATVPPFLVSVGRKEGIDAFGGWGRQVWH